MAGNETRGHLPSRISLARSAPERRGLEGFADGDEVPRPGTSKEERVKPADPVVLSGVEASPLCEQMFVDAGATRSTLLWFILATDARILRRRRSRSAGHG